MGQLLRLSLRRDRRDTAHFRVRIPVLLKPAIRDYPKRDIQGPLKYSDLLHEAICHPKVVGKQHGLLFVHL